MNKQQILQWEKDIKYYDPEGIELRKLFSIYNFKNKRVLDVGCGIGRFTLPIAKYAKEITALDINPNIIKYCKRNKNRKNIKFILSDVREFHEGDFDAAIFAQPFYENFSEIMRAAWENLRDGGKLIILRWIDKGNDYTNILSPFWEKNKKLIKKVDIFSKNFTKKIKKLFRLNKIYLVNTYYRFPNENELFNNILQDIPPGSRDRGSLKKLIKKYDCRKIKVALKIYVCEKRGR